MEALRVVILADPLDGDAVRRAAAAVGAVAISVDPLGDVTGTVASARADVAVVVTGSFVRDTARAVQRMRGSAGRRLPLMLVADPADLALLESQVDLALQKPVAPERLMARAAALALARSVQPPGTLRSEGAGLRRVAATIDDALDAEMLAALRTVGADPPPAAAPAKAPTGADPVGAWLEEATRSVAAIPAETVPAETGDLGDTDMAMLLGRLYLQGFTGRLSARRSGVRKLVYFEAGRPVFAVSNSPEDRLVEMLARAGKLSTAEYQTATRAADETGRRMGALLVDLGVLKSSELLPAIRRHYDEIVLSLFRWTAGAWTLERDVLANVNQTRLLAHPAALVGEGLRGWYPEGRIEARLGGPENVLRAVLRGRAADLVPALVPSAEECHVPLLLDGVRPLSAVAQAAGLPQAAVNRVAYALSLFGMLVPAGDAVAVTAADAGNVRDLEIERERVRTRHAFAVDGDYFQVLGVARDASNQEVRRAYDRLRAECDPESVGPVIAREMSGQLETIRCTLEEAVRVLDSPRLRAAYMQALPPLAAVRLVPARNGRSADEQRSEGRGEEGIR